MSRQAQGRHAALPRLHVVTDDRVLAGDGWTGAAADVLEAGGTHLALHLRGPRTDGAVLCALASTLLPVSRRSGSLVIVNDRVDVAMVTGADGAHLGRRSLAVRAARRLLGAAAWLGASLHDPDATSGLSAEGADFAFLGTIFPTPSHPAAEGLGPASLRRAVAGAGALRVLGIGGIGPDRVEPVMAAGAYGVAVLGGVWNRDDPAAAVGSYLAELAKVVEPGRRIQ